MKVSVSILAYNHEPYIEQSVRSVLAQRTNFDYEIIIGEDYSKDRTLDILRHLNEQYPGTIHLLTTDHNLGMYHNYIRTLRACKGEYIALLDGDDYWCAEDKLQKQVDFLDHHPDYAAVFHCALRVYEDGSRQPKVFCPPQGKYIFEIDDLIRSNFIPTCSALLRSRFKDDFPDWAGSLNMLDWLTYILAAKYGKIRFIDEVMGVYRVHSSGVWSSLNPMKKLMADIGFYEKLDPYLDYRYTKTIRANLNRNWTRLMNELYDRAITLVSTKEALVFAEEILAPLSEHESFPPRWKKETLERIYCYFLITNFENGYYSQAWATWLGMMKNDPFLLLNRGLFLIGVESSFNGRLRPFIQRFTRSDKSENE